MSNAREAIKRQIKTLKTRIFGLDKEIEAFCLSKASGLTTLLLGPHGTAKSTLARLWSNTLGFSFRIVSADEVSPDLIAYLDAEEFRRGRVVWRRGDVMSYDHVLLDEWYLWNPKYRAILHQLLEEGSYKGLQTLTKTYTLAANPPTDLYQGSYGEVNFATQDRIDVCIYVPQPEAFVSHSLIKKFGKFGRKEPPLVKVANWEDYLAAREEIINIPVESEAEVYLALLAEEFVVCKHTRNHQDKLSLSRAELAKLCANCNRNAELCAKFSISKPRFLRATILLAKAYAWWRGRDEVTAEDVKDAVKYTLIHRLVKLKDEEPDIDSIIKKFEENMERRKLERGEVGGNAFSFLTSIIDEAEKFGRVKDTSTFERVYAEDLPLISYERSLVRHVKDALYAAYLERVESTKSVAELRKLKDAVVASGLEPERIDRIIAAIEQKLEMGAEVEEELEYDGDLVKLVNAVAAAEAELGGPADKVKILRALRTSNAYASQDFSVEVRGELTVKGKERAVKVFEKYYLGVG